MALNENGSFCNHGKENISTALEPSSPPFPPPPYSSYDTSHHHASSTPSDNNVPCPSYSITGQPYAAGAQMYHQPPPPPLQHPGVPYNGTAYTQVDRQQVFVVDPQPPVILVAQQPGVSMAGAIALSCVVFWLFGWLFGGVAFVLALIGQNSASAGDRQTAVRLKNASFAVSLAGVFVAVIIIIVVVIASFSSVKNNTQCYNYAYDFYYRC